MCKLILRRGSIIRELEFEAGARLEDVLSKNGITLPMPCGGGGRCGKCKVELSGKVNEANAAEIRAGSRLICQAVLLGDTYAVLSDEKDFANIETSGTLCMEMLKPMGKNYGAAVDIGTTTIVLKLYDLSNGSEIASAGMKNPQTSVAADVMGRIGAALEGSLEKMQAQVSDAISKLLKKACENAKIEVSNVDPLILTGNTTMLYLLTGKNPEALAHAPFEADCLFDEWREFGTKRAYLPPCMHAFVGADITCAVLASGMCENKEPSILLDIGTNGEIALWKDGKLYVSSTAAGPAFEGAGISCGCSSVNGAIDSVRVEEGKIRFSTIGDSEPVGLCGSGLIDAIASFLKLEVIDETGAVNGNRLALDEHVFLVPSDVRAVQLAKAAIAAGLQTLMETADLHAEDISVLYIAGGFGSHLNIDSAVQIGLIPNAFRSKVRIIGNAALTGAAMLLLHTDNLKHVQRIVQKASHVNLGGNTSFNENYMEHMLFTQK